MRTEGFFYNLDLLNGGLGIGKLQFLIKKKKIISAVIFFQFLVIKALDPYWIRISIWIRIRIGLQHHTLDPDPDPKKMNTDPQPWCLHALFKAGTNPKGFTSVADPDPGSGAFFDPWIRDG